jgi:Ser/Thr protein kinase RdoA (MazF antagonist)
MVEHIKSYAKKAYNSNLLSIHPVSNQYSSVYKVTTSSASYALLLYRPNKPLKELQSELRMYKHLNSVVKGDLSFPNPLETDLAIDGMKLQGRFAILFDWVEHRPYENDPHQKEQAFTAYCHLNDLLKGIHYDDFDISKAGPFDGAFDPTSKNYTRLNFEQFKNPKTKALLVGNQESLKRASLFVNDYYIQNKEQIEKNKFQIIHNDLTPRNFGFSEDAHVNFIMDFDLCKIGLWQYDLSWMIWRFCFDQKKSPDTNLEEIQKAMLFFKERNSGLEMDFFLFLLLGRLLLTLDGRLKNYEKAPSAGLRFVPSKITEIHFLSEYLM